jgi:hypothetical protein
MDMSKFTTDNSEFNGSQCSILNQAFDQIVSFKNYDVENKSLMDFVSDSLNNAWNESIENNADALVSAVLN